MNLTRTKKTPSFLGQVPMIELMNELITRTEVTALIVHKDCDYELSTDSITIEDKGIAAILIIKGIDI
jgi:hypothetical protein